VSDHARLGAEGINEMEEGVGGLIPRDLHVGRRPVSCVRRPIGRQER
jgi:hypothetical protein